MYMYYYELLPRCEQLKKISILLHLSVTQPWEHCPLD